MGIFLKRNVFVFVIFVYGFEGVYQYWLGIGMILEVYEVLYKLSRR